MVVLIKLISIWFIEKVLKQHEVAEKTIAAICAGKNAKKTVITAFLCLLIFYLFEVFLLEIYMYFPVLTLIGFFNFNGLLCFQL